MLKRKSRGIDAGTLAVRYIRSNSTPPSALGGLVGRVTNGKTRREAQTVRPQIGDQIGREEDRSLFGAVIGGEELAAICVHMCPHLVGVGHAEPHPELGVVDDARDHDRDHPCREHRQEPPAVLTSSATRRNQHAMSRRRRRRPSQSSPGPGWQRG